MDWLRGKSSNNKNKNKNAANVFNNSAFNTAAPATNTNFLKKNNATNKVNNNKNKNKNKTNLLTNRSAGNAMLPMFMPPPAMSPVMQTPGQLFLNRNRNLKNNSRANNCKKTQNQNKFTNSTRQLQRLQNRINDRLRLLAIMSASVNPGAPRKHQALSYVMSDLF